MDDPLAAIAVALTVWAAVCAAIVVASWLGIE